MRIVIATNNEHKADEISNMFSDMDIEFMTLAEAGIVSDPVEDADTFEGNARIKAIATKSALPQDGCGYAVLADDSGLEVDALDGEPGVFSSRYAGEDGNDEANNDLLLERLDGKPFEDRTARFVCTMVLIGPDREETVSRGEVEGRIGFERRGREGFGYDPLFYPEEYEWKKTFAEVPQSEKNVISHRSRALHGLSEAMHELASKDS